MRYKIVLMLVLVVFITPLLATEYTLNDLLDAALENNKTLIQSRLSLERSRANMYSARINYLPDVSASIGRRESWDNIAFDRDEDRQYTNHFMGFSISKSIALNNSDYFSNRNARFDFSSAELAYEKQFNNVIYQIIQSYIGVLESQKRVNLYEEDIRIQESIISESNLLFRQNKITQFQLQQSEINLLNSKINSLNAQNNLNDSRKKLFDLINITDEGWTLAEIDLYANEKDFSREIDFDQILDIKQQEIKVQQHKTSITRSKLDFFPNITLRYDYGRDASSEKISFDPGRYSTSHQLSLNLSYSLNNLFRNHYSYKNLRSVEEHNSLDTAQMIKDISLEYNKLMEELRYLEQLQVLQASRMEQTTTSLQMAQQRYRLGLLTQLDLDKASYEYLQSRIALENSHYQIILKKLSIDNLLSNRLH